MKKKLGFGCEGKKTNNSCNLCLKSSRGECKFIILQGKFSLEERGGGVVLVIFAQSGARHKVNDVVRYNLRGIFYSFCEVVKVKPKLSLLVYFWI